MALVLLMKMMKASVGFRVLPWLRVLLVVALSFSAFSHRAAFAAAAPDSAAYMLPDGTIPGICFGGGGTDGPDQHSRAGCEFCRLAASVLLPEPPGLSEPMLPAVSVTYVPLVTKGGIPASSGGPLGPRAPPIA